MLPPIDMFTHGVASWRVAHMLVHEDGPNNLFYKLRVHTGIEYGPDDEPDAWPAWNPLTCVLCTSIWVGLVLVLLPKSIINLLAALGVAALIELERR